MRTRIWEIRKDKFDLLMNILPYTKRMKQALQDRYDNSWKSRSSVAGKFDLTEHGIMKAEKNLIKVNNQLEDSYGSRL